MNIKSKEYSLVKILLSFEPLLTVSECAKRINAIRANYNMGAMA